MYALVLRLSFSPEKTIEAITTINSTAGPVMDDPDCLSFHFYRKVANDDAFVLWEEWESMEALKQHIRSGEFMKILTVMDLAKQKPEINIHTLSDRKGFEFIKSLRKGIADTSS